MGYQTVLVSVALLASVQTCSSLLESAPYRAELRLAFSPALLRPSVGPRARCLSSPQQRRCVSGSFAGGCRRSGSFAGRPLGAPSLSLPRVSKLLRGSASAVRPAWTCVFGGPVGGGFMDDDTWGEDDLWASEVREDGDENDWRTVLLKDTRFNRTIECFVDREIEVEGRQYATLMPADTPVIMAGYKSVNGSQQLVPVLEDKMIDKLFPTAHAVLSELDLHLSRSAVVLTVEELEDISVSDSEEDDDDDEFVVLDLGRRGDSSLSYSMFDDDSEDSDDFDDEEILSLGPGPNGLIGLRRGELIDREAGEVDGPPRLGYSEDSEEDEEEDESEKVQVLANFCYEGNKYVVATPLEPVLIIGSPVLDTAEKKAEVRMGGDLEIISKLPGGASLASDMQEAEDSNRIEYLLPDKEELDRVTPKIEQELETMLDTEEKERKVLVRLRQQLINQWQRSD